MFIITSYNSDKHSFNNVVDADAYCDKWNKAQCDYHLEAGKVFEGGKVHWEVVVHDRPGVRFFGYVEAFDEEEES